MPKKPHAKGHKPVKGGRARGASVHKPKLPTGWFKSKAKK